jgi:PAS domain S-box-containing protein
MIILVIIQLRLTSLQTNITGGFMETIITDDPGFFQLGRHICWLYDQPHQYTSVIIPYITSGLSQHQKIIYVFDPKVEPFFSRKAILKEVGKLINPLDHQLEFLTTDQMYFENTIFTPDFVANQIRTFTTQAIGQGYSGVRISAEMSWLFSREQEPELLIQYEAQINEVIRDLPAIGLCQYRKDIFPPTILNRILDTHPFIITGNTFLTNYSFIDPNELLKEDKEKRILENRISNIEGMNDKIHRKREKNLLLEEQVLARTAELSATISHLEALFNSTPMPILEEDYSDIHQIILEIQKDHPIDFNEYIGQHPGFIQQMAKKKKIIAANPYALIYHNAKSTQELDDVISDQIRMGPGLFKKLLNAVWTGKTSYQETDIIGVINEKTVYFDFTWLAIPLQRQDYSRVIIMIQDVTQRKLALDKAQLSESRLDEAQKLTNLGSLEFSSINGQCLCSDMLMDILGYAPTSQVLRREDIIQHIYPDDRPRLINILRKALTQKFPEQFECRFTTKSGAIKHGVISVKVEHEPGNRHRRLFATMLDVTEIKRISQALTQSEEKYKKLVELSIEAIIITNETGRIVEWNQAAENIFGITRNEATGKYIWEIELHASSNIENLELSPKYLCKVIKKILSGSGAEYENQQYLIKITTPQGISRDILSIIYSIPTDRGIIVGVTSLDVTDQHRQQIVLAEREERYRLIAEVSSDCAYTLIIQNDQQVTCEWTNETFSRVTGWQFDEMEFLGGFPTIVYPDDLQIYMDIREQGMHGNVASGEYRILTRAGEIRWIHDLRKPVLDESGSVIKVHGAISDITKRKTAEIAIQESELHFRELFETMPTGVVFHNTNGELTSMNLAASQIIGSSINQFSNPDCIINDHPIILEDGMALQPASHPIHSALKTGLIIRNILLGVYNIDENRTKWVLTSSIPQFRFGQNKPYQVCTLFQDITSIKEANQALEDSELRFRTLIEKSPIAIGINRDGKTLYANQYHQKLFRYTSLDDIIGTAILNQIAPEEKGKVLERINNRRLGLPVATEYKSIGIRADGTKFPFFAGITQVSLPDGPAWIGYFIDITDQVNAEKSLQETNRVLSALIQASPLAIICLDLDQKVTLWTPSAEKLFGWSAGEVLGKELPTIPTELRNEFDTLFIQSTTLPPLINYETQRIHKDGSRIDVSISNSVQYKSTGEKNGVMTILVDISKRKIAERQLEKSLAELHALSARLVTIREEERSRISREIHDELGQNLTGLKMDLFRINKRLSKYDDHQSVEQILGQTADMIELVDLSINSVRRIATELRPSILDTLGIIPAVEWLVSDFQSRVGIHCEFISLVDHFQPSTEVSTALFRVCQEALTNIIRHADASQVIIILDAYRDRIQMTIEDNGRGFDVEEITNTHSLGLIGMKERIIALNGEFLIQSTPSSGTLLTARIPK